jgi:hypothetical protein
LHVAHDHHAGRLAVVDPHREARRTVPRDAQIGVPSARSSSAPALALRVERDHGIETGAGHEQEPALA